MADFSPWIFPWNVTLKISNLSQQLCWVYNIYILYLLSAILRAHLACVRLFRYQMKGFGVT